MTDSAFRHIAKVEYEGPNTPDPLSYRYYQPGRDVLGKPMSEHLRIAICYWHTFCGTGDDMFGEGIYRRPWFGDTMEAARLKAQHAFEFFEKLGTPFFCFHDRDVAPEGASLREFNDNVSRIADIFEKEMERTGVRLLWGTANLFSHPRYAAGASTNPDPEVFMYAAAQVKHALEVTHRLGGENYVLWGGREGYDTLLNTDLRRESDQLARFLSLVVEHKRKIGFRGTLLIEPKPHEPTSHQYDHDTATVHAFLRRYDLQDEFKVNIEANHALLAGHSFQHEVAYAMANDLFGSVDINRGDPLLGWDTDQFPNSVEELTLVLYTILQGSGFSSGGFNFDAKLRRQSLDPEDLFYAHVGGIDTLAHALLCAARLIESGALSRFVDDRYAGWKTGSGAQILAGKMDFESIARHVHESGIDPQPRSGRQEMLETIVNQHIRKE